MAAVEESNPWTICDNCGARVSQRDAGMNRPCGCWAAAVSLCPTWATAGACRCDDPDAVRAAASTPPPAPEPPAKDDRFVPTTVLIAAGVVLVGLALWAARVLS